MLAAVVQVLVTDDLDVNLTKAANLVRDAARAGAKLVVLPEMVEFRGEKEDVAKIKSNIPGPVSQHFADLAKELGIWILAGSIHENIADSERCYNTSLLFSPEGEQVAQYRKLHLYDVQIPGRVDACESATIAPGSEVVTADMDGHKVGLSICYDIRFPELYRALAEDGAELIFLPANFMMFTGKDHWEVLIRARAIENQCYMLASGQQGVDARGVASYGRSMIVDPWGTVVAVAPDGEGFAMADIDFDRVARIRTELPSLANRRREVLA